MVLRAFGAAFDDIAVRTRGHSTLLNADDEVFARIDGAFDTLAPADFAFIA